MLGFMRGALVITLLFSQVALAQAQAPASGDSLFRAAYCMGVLRETRRFNDSPAGKEKGSFICDGGQWQMRGYKSFDACMASLRSDVDQGFAQRQKRYADFVDLSSKGHTDQMAQIMAARKKGEEDTQAVRNSKEQSSGQCALICKAQPPPPGKDVFEDCLIPCVERQDPVAANVMRCLMLPDRLPF